MNRKRLSCHLMKLIQTINHLLSITVFLMISSYLQGTTEDMRAEYGAIVFNHVWSISNCIKEKSLNTASCHHLF
jgi:hypothetical protein